MENAEAQNTEVAEKVENTATQGGDNQSQSYEGNDKVDFSPDQQKRVNKIYGELKRTQRESAELAKIAREQYEIINKIQSDQEKIVSHLHEKDYSEAERILRQQKKTARENGDFDAVDEIDDKLLEIKARKASMQKETQPKQQQQASQPRQLNINDAVDRGAITSDEATVYTAWANEKDDYGELKRPWVNATDPTYRAALVEGQAVFNNPKYANKPFSEKLAEIDRRMGLENRAAGQAVMGSNLTKGQANGKLKSISLTPNQERIAIRTQFAGHGKSQEEHLAAYKKQIEAMKGAKR